MIKIKDKVWKLIILKLRKTLEYIKSDDVQNRNKVEEAR